jgi:hypothetical protein
MFMFSVSQFRNQWQSADLTYNHLGGKSTSGTGSTSKSLTENSSSELNPLLPTTRSRLERRSVIVVQPPINRTRTLLESTTDSIVLDDRVVQIAPAPERIDQVDIQTRVFAGVVSMKAELTKRDFLSILPSVYKGDEEEAGHVFHALERVAKNPGLKTLASSLSNGEAIRRDSFGVVRRMIVVDFTNRALPEEEQPFQLFLNLYNDWKAKGLLSQPDVRRDFNLLLRTLAKDEQIPVIQNVRIDKLFGEGLFRRSLITQETRVALNQALGKALPDSADRVTADEYAELLNSSRVRQCYSRYSGGNSLLLLIKRHFADGISWSRLVEEQLMSLKTRKIEIESNADIDKVEALLELNEKVLKFEEFAKSISWGPHYRFYFQDRALPLAGALSAVSALTFAAICLSGPAIGIPGLALCLVLPVYCFVRFQYGLPYLDGKTLDSIRKFRESLSS